VNWSSGFIELNKETHDRDSFDCGEGELNEFLQQRAAKHMRAGISTTMILPAAAPLPNGKYPICAFYTITPGSVARETLPESLKKKLPHYPVPVFLVAQLAVHNEYKGRGLGKITLVKALEYLWNINKHMRAYAVIVDCLNPDIRQFYAQYGFQVLGISEEKTRMFLPMETVGALF
jgi:GNAT superfamily N-acetyltransferase